MNNNNYIRLKYFDNNDYEIVINLDDNRIRLKNKDAKIMHLVLNEFPYSQINKNTFIYPNCSKILATYNKIRKKHNKPKRVNRSKSKQVLVGTVTASIILSLSIAGISAYNVYKNDQQQEKIFEIANYNSEKLEQIAKKLLENESTINILEQDEIGEIKNDYEKDFHYYFEKIGDRKAFDNAKEYDQIFSKYEQMYGIDKVLLCAIAAQESSGIHKDYSENGAATGLMGIENIWKDAELDVYNFETQSYEIIRIDYEKIASDVDYNIKVGAAIFQCYFNEIIKTNLIPDEELLAYTTQTYNMGLGNMNKISKTGMHWTDARSIVKAGDKNYFEHVFSRLQNNTTINIRQKDGKYFSTNISNEALKIESKTL